MLKQFVFLFMLLTLSFFGFSNQLAINEDSASHFGTAQFLMGDEYLSLDEIRQNDQLNWQSIEVEDTSFGFDSRHFWLKIPLVDVYSSTSPWFLRSKYPLLDTIDVYLLADEELVQEFHTGDSLPFNERPIKQPNFVFPLDINI